MLFHPSVAEFLWKALLALGVLAFASIAQGQELKAFGEWHAGWSDQDKAARAWTMNESGSGLIMECSAETTKCVWLVISDTECDEGSSYAALLNSELGSRAFDLLCLGLARNRRYRMALGDFSEASAIIVSGKGFGLAIAMESGRFKVLRFSLVGSRAAMDHAITLFQRMSGRSSASRDQLL